MGTHKETHLRRRQRLLNFLTPLAASFDMSIVPDGDIMIAGEGREHDLESLQPPGILMPVADEDLRALWGSVDRADVREGGRQARPVAYLLLYGRPA